MGVLLSDSASTAELMQFPMGKWSGKQFDLRKLDQESRHSDKVAGGLEICERQGYISKCRKTNDKKFGLTDFPILFDKYGGLRRKRTSEGDPLLDWDGNVVKSMNGKPFNGGNTSLNIGRYNTDNITVMKEFEDWFNKMFPRSSSNWNIFQVQETSEDLDTEDPATQTQATPYGPSDDYKIFELKQKNTVLRLQMEVIQEKIHKHALHNLRMTVKSTVEAAHYNMLIVDEKNSLTIWNSVLAEIQGVTDDIYEHMNKIRNQEEENTRTKGTETKKSKKRKSA